MSQDINLLIIGAVIGSVSPLLILLVTLYFQNKREIRARKWELEDRQSSRRLDVLAMRVTEAQAYLLGFYEATQKLMMFELTIIATQNVDNHIKDWEKIPALLTGINQKVISFAILQDEVLHALHEELNQVFRIEHKNAIELMDSIRKKDIPDKDIVVERVTQYYKKSSVLIAEMQQRIDELTLARS
jgi:hypothetical protein